MLKAIPWLRGRGPGSQYGLNEEKIQIFLRTIFSKTILLTIFSKTICIVEIEIEIEIELEH
jgi:hypothetical protein